MNNSLATKSHDLNQAAHINRHSDSDFVIMGSSYGGRAIESDEQSVREYTQFEEIETVSSNELDELALQEYADDDPKKIHVIAGRS